jgi:hypothetical protein
MKAVARQVERKVKVEVEIFLAVFRRNLKNRRIALIPGIRHFLEARGFKTYR